MARRLILLLLFIPLVFSCSDSEEILGTPVLVITNENAKPLAITSVKLVGYEFNNLNISEGKSKTFILDSGITGGDSHSSVDLTILCNIGPQTFTKSTGGFFNNGETTTITISDPDPLDTTPMNCVPLVIQVTYD